ncbi:MAG TPA: EAL domain-containing protein [Baekduia sp.]|uniref:sensor domain-containing protein n=1 Tax=Baekduia sp. TaxID=2600305 RepID=UPI002D79AEDF|nr:EAL domain-containing protein [Baekduia sp.]HET6505646.1 EAL domain-containing protein [Baekduia sp.]
MVHRSAPPRLTAAFGIMLVAAGAITLTRGALVGSTVPVAAGGIVAFALGAGIHARRERLSFAQVGWIAVASTVIVAFVTASRDTPEGSGFALAWAAPFAYAAGRRVGIAHTLASGVALAVAFGLQALRVDHPLPFGTYVSSWVAAVATAAIVGAVARVILDSLERTQRQLDAGFEQGLLGQAFIDLSGRWTQVNGAFAAMIGRTPEQLVGRPVIEVTHPGDHATAHENLADAEADQLDTVVYDKRFVRPDGTVCWTTVHAVVLHDRGMPTGFFAEYTDITAQREAEERLRTSERRFERMFRDAGVGMVIISAGGQVLQANPAAAEILGTTLRRLLGADIRDWRHPDDHEAGEAAVRSVMVDGNDAYHRDGRMVRDDGREIHVALTGAVVRDASGAVDHAILQLLDVTDRDAAQRRESALAELGRLALATNPVELLGAAVRAIAQTLGVPFATVVGADSGAVMAAHGWDGAAAIEHARAALDGVGPLELHDPETELRFPTRALTDAGAVAGVAVAVAGEGDAPFAVLTVHAAVGARRFDHGELAFLASAGHVLTAAVRRDAAERELRHRALHDPITRLPNRALLVDRLRHALTRARREHRSVAALFIDVDDFKDVNDRHGHEGGDELLRMLGPRLQGALRANDTLARFGADEFVVVCEDLDDPEEALAVADRLLEAAAAPCTLAGHTIRQTASIGIALSQGAEADVDAEALLRDADLAMHRAKLAGKGRYEVFAHAMRELALDRVALLNDLDRAIAQDELALVFQPIVRLSDGALHAAEALVRWHHPERGTIMPDEFIGLAERTGRIAELGRWVLREAAREAARWPGLIVGVNASRLQLSAPGFVDDVARVLGEHGIAPGRFTVEVTETALMEDPAAAEATLQALRDLGVRIALDDFGTGYSSLSSVSDFPLSTLKLDRAFLADHRPESQRWSIVRAVLDMARTLDLDVVVEGVETHAQRIALSELGAVHGQGFLFSRPVPPDELTAMYAAAAVPSQAI